MLELSEAACTIRLQTPALPFVFADVAKRSRRMTARPGMKAGRGHSRLMARTSSRASQGRCAYFHAALGGLLR